LSNTIKYGLVLDEDYPVQTHRLLDYD